MGKWRFRTNWRGRLVLQRKVYVGMGMLTDWCDASSTDLADYYHELRVKGVA